MHNRKLGRTSDHRIAMLRNLAASLIIHEKIETTQHKALELRSWMDKLITLAKRNDLHARRQAATMLFNVMADDEQSQSVLQKLFDDVGVRYSERQGGYTRVLKTVQRRGDGAPMAIIELV